MPAETPPLKTADDCMAFAQAINQKKEPLTIKKLKSFPGCEQYTDAEATQIIQTIDLLTSILFECTTTEAKVVYLEDAQQHQLYPVTKNKVA